MSHHSSEPDKGMHEAMQKAFGEYPNGKLNENDAGALALAISNERGVVKISFPKPVAWIGFTGDQAMEIAALLIKHAREVGATAPFVLRV